MAADARLAVAATADATEAALLVETRLLALRAEKAPVAQFTQNAGTLHSSLEAP